MEINVKSLKFNADQKLLDFVQKKVSRLSKFFEGMDTVDVTLSLSKEPDNKNVKLQTRVLGQDLVITRNAKTFEDAVTAAVDAMKESIVRSKEKVIEK
jgi:putative sigma-54 modulation protein